MLFLGLVLLITLRDYLAGAVALGIFAWALVRYLSLRRAVLVAAGTALAFGAVGAVAVAMDPDRVNALVHEIYYRQTVTRMETLGRLYRDPPPLDAPLQLPYRPGAVIALTDPQTGWLLTGIVADSSQPGLISVDLTDNTSRTVPIEDVQLLGGVRVQPLQLFTWVLPSAGSVLLGLPVARETPNPAWVASALAWDALLVLAGVAVWRSRMRPEHWALPVCVTLCTVLALCAIPGAPGNAERHRANQTLPFLVVFASGLAVSSRRRSVEGSSEDWLTSPSSTPASDTTAVASATRSAR
jgi:hypothetical protein